MVLFYNNDNCVISLQVNILVIKDCSALDPGFVSLGKKVTTQCLVLPILLAQSELH